MIDAREKLESTFGNYYCARHSNAAISKAGGESFRYVESFSTLLSFNSLKLPTSLRAREFEISDFAIASYKRPLICTNHPLNQARYVARFDVCIACPSMKSIYETRRSSE